MIDGFRKTALVLLTLALIDGTINVIEWLTCMDIFRTTFTVGLGLLLASMLLDENSLLNQTLKDNKCAKKNKDINALATAIVAHVSC